MTRMIVSQKCLRETAESKFGVARRYEGVERAPRPKRNAATVDFGRFEIPNERSEQVSRPKKKYRLAKRLLRTGLNSGVAARFHEIEHGSPRYGETLEIRDRILRAPLGLHFSDTEIAEESKDFHLVATDPESGAIAGCLVLSPIDPEVVQMRQVAVVESRRGRGIGRELVAFAERFASGRGYLTMKLHAREPVVDFYLGLGYAVTGSPFVEVTIPHREMRKTLDRQPESRG